MSADPSNELATNTLLQQSLGEGPGVSGGPGIVQSFTRQEDHGKSKTVTFSKTYIHFLGPGTEYSGASLETNSDKEMVYAFDFGASLLPYNICRASVKPNHLYKYMFHANSYRIHGHSVKCTDLVCTRDEIQADGRIVSTAQQDTIEVFRDTNNKFRPHNYVGVGGRGLFELNSGFRRTEPRDVQEGLLPRVKVQFPSEMYESTKLEQLKDFKISGFDPYNGLFDVSTWRTGTEYSASHSFDSGRIPTGSFSQMSKLPCNKNTLKVANKLLDTVWGIQANMSTQANRSPIMPAPQHMFRFAPIYTATGKMQRRAQFKATYSTTITFYYSPDIGVEMFMLGEQGNRVNFPYDDPYDNSAADLKRFNFGVHAEDFVMPLTSYLIEESDEIHPLKSEMPHPTYIEPVPVIKPEYLESTLQNIIKKQLEEARLNVIEPKDYIDDTTGTVNPVNDGESSLVTHVYQTGVEDTVAYGLDKVNIPSKKVAALLDKTEPQADQVDIQYCRNLLKDQGWDNDEVNQLYAKIDHTEHADTDTEYKILGYKMDDDGVVVEDLDATEQAGLIGTDAGQVVLPISATLDDTGSVNIDNRRWMRPGQAWKAIGLPAPSWKTRDKKGYYTPFPNFGDKSGGRAVTKHFCQIEDIEKIRELNMPNKLVKEDGKVVSQPGGVNLAEKMAVINRALDIDKNPNNKGKIPADVVPAAQLLQSTITTPLQVKGPKIGKKLPPTKVAHIPDDVEIQFSPWTASTQQAVTIQTPQAFLPPTPSDKKKHRNKKFRLHKQSDYLFQPGDPDLIDVPDEDPLPPAPKKAKLEPDPQQAGPSHTSAGSGGKLPDSGSGGTS